MTRGRNPVQRCGGSGSGGSVGSRGTVTGSSTGKGTLIVNIARSDDKKQGIKNSKVLLIGPGSSVQRRAAKADAQGNATFKDLEPGTYTFKHELPDTFLVSLAHMSEVTIPPGGHALGTAKAYATGTLKIRVVDTLTKAVIPVCTATTTTAPQAITWDAKGGGEQTFAAVAPGKYEATASADPATYLPLLRGRAPAGMVSVVAGGTGVMTIELMPRSWIKVLVQDTVRNRTLSQATVKLQPSGAALQTAATEGSKPLEFEFTKESKSCAVVDISVDGDDLYEVIGVDAA